MKLAARSRLLLARHPSAYWLTVGVLSAGVAVGVQLRLDRVDEARERWSTTRAVAVATTDHEPGDTLSTRALELPLVAIPPTAIGEARPGARATQRIGAGEVVVEADTMPPAGPASGAEPGALVVPVVDPLARDVRIGQALRVVAEGIVLADDATVVEVIDDVVFVAVAPDDAALIAAAAKSNTTSLLFVP